MLTNMKYLYPKGHNCKMYINSIHLNSPGVLIYTCVYACTVHMQACVLPVCLCVQEREGEQNGLQGTLCTGDM